MSEEAAPAAYETTVPNRQWLDEAVELPKVPLMNELRNHLSPAGLFMAYSVGTSVLKMVDNCKSSERIPEEAKLPILEDKYDSVLKVIRDFRILNRPFSLLANWGNIGDQEEFDARTRQMEKDKIYLGGPAKLKVSFDDERQSTSLIRTVTYYRAAPSKTQLSGVASMHIHSCDRSPTPTMLLALLRVGVTYKHGTRGTSRVQLAEILRAGNSKPRKSTVRRQRKRLLTLDLAPKTALGVN